MKTKYFRIEDPQKGVYGLYRSGTILAIRNNKVWLLEDRYTCDDIYGNCYRNYVNGKQKLWPKSSNKAIDKTKEWNKIMEDADIDIDIEPHDFPPQSIKALLNL